MLAKNSPQKWVPPSCIKMFSFFMWKYCCVLPLWCGDNPDENVKWLSKRQNLYHYSCYSYNCYSVECQDELTVTIWPQVFRILIGEPNYYRYIATHIFLGLHSNGKTVTMTDVVGRGFSLGLSLSSVFFAFPALSYYLFKCVHACVYACLLAYMCACAIRHNLQDHKLDLWSLAMTFPVRA